MRSCLTLFILLSIIIINPLAYGGEMEVTVLDKETSVPIPDAEVKIEFSLNNASSEALESITNTKGTCTILIPIDRLPDLIIIADAPEYLGKIQRWNSHSPVYYYKRSNSHSDDEQNKPHPKEYTISLKRPGITIGGRIIDEEGSPIYGATIGIVSKSQDRDRGTNFTGRYEDLYEVISDYDGRWICEKIPSRPEAIVMIIQHPLYSNRRVFCGGLDRKLLPKLKEMTHTVTLRKGLTIYGYVHDSGNKPITSALIYYDYNDKALNMRRSIPPTNVTAEADGWFALENLKKQWLFINIMAEGYASYYHEVKIDEGIPDLDITLEKGLTVRGIVQDRFGNPINDAIVVAKATDDYRLYLNEWSMATGPDGRFSYDRVPAEGKNFVFLNLNFGHVEKIRLIPDGTEYIITLDDSQKSTEQPQTFKGW